MTPFYTFTHTDTSYLMYTSLLDLLDEEKCYAYVVHSKGSSSATCPSCGSTDIRKNGHDKGATYRQRYLCKSCRRTFTDLTDSVVAGNHIPLQKWVVCDVLREQLPRHRLARILDLSDETIEFMIQQLKSGMHKKNIPTGERRW